jgi:hypothetical protein
VDEFIEKCLNCKELNPNGEQWIPTQEELQALVREGSRYSEMNDLKLDVYMRACLFKMCCQNVLLRVTFNEMWLMFYMKEVHNKRWYVQRKEWI